MRLSTTHRGLPPTEAKEKRVARLWPRRRPAEQQVTQSVPQFPDHRTSESDLVRWRLWLLSRRSTGKRAAKEAEDWLAKLAGYDEPPTASGTTITVAFLLENPTRTTRMVADFARRHSMLPASSQGHHAPRRPRSRGAGRPAGGRHRGSSSPASSSDPGGEPEPPPPGSRKGISAYGHHNLSRRRWDPRGTER